MRWKMRNIKLFGLTAILIVLISANAFAKGELFIFGAMNFINASGSASDYKEGENDFPITKSHQNPCFGLGITFLLAKNIFLGLEGNYNISGKAILEDPSDNDTVEIDTIKNANFFVTLRLNLLGSQNSFNLFLNGGAGLNYILEKETRIYTSKFGYETEILPPKNKTNLTGFGGIGIIYRMSNTIGLLLNARYLYISLEDNPKDGFVVLGGLNIGF